MNTAAVADGLYDYMGVFILCLSRESFHGMIPWKVDPGLGSSERLGFGDLGLVQICKD